MMRVGQKHLSKTRDRFWANGENNHLVNYTQRQHSLNDLCFAALFGVTKVIHDDLYRAIEAYSARIERIERALSLTVDAGEMAARQLDHLNVERSLAADARVAAASGRGLDHAHAMIITKAVEEGARRIFRGMASTSELDRMGDVIDPLGASWDGAGVPLLAAHDHQRPIGLARLGPATSKGIAFEAEIATVDTPGPLKDRVDTAWGEIRAGVVRAVSIGFRPDRSAVEVLPTGGLRYRKIEIFELSTVSVPANASARISHVGEAQ